MLNYFRQLTLPWLVAVSLMLVFTATWYQYEAKLQQQAQVQQFSAALQLAVAPYLISRNYQALGNHLGHASAVSSLPIKAIALLSSSGTILAVTQAASISEQSIHQQYLASENITSYQLKHVDHLLVAVQPVSALQFNSADLPIDNIGQFYLLIMVEHELAFGVWLLPMIVVFLFGLMVLIWIRNGLSQQQQRQQIDISLVAHKLRQLQQGQLNCRIDEGLMPDLEPIKQSFNSMAEQSAEYQLSLQQQLTIQDSQLGQLQAQLTQTVNQTQQLEQQHIQHQQYLAYCAKNIQLIYQQKTGLEPLEQSQLVSSQLTLLKLLALDLAYPAEQLLLTSFVAEPLSAYQAWLSQKQIKLVLFEAAANATHQISFNSFILTTLLTSLLQATSQNVAVDQITLRVELVLTDAAYRLNISVVSDGEGLSKRQQQLFDTTDITQLHWQEVDYAILIVLMKKFAMTKQFHSLEGLGCTIKLSIPLTDVEPINIKRLPTILLFDTDIEHLHERKQALSELAAQVSYCSNLADLSLKAEQHHIDTIIIFLPEPVTLSLWQQTLAKLAQHSRVLCYANFDTVDAWQQALTNILQSQMFSLHTLLAANVNENKTLLVVDDNQTNLAFLQVLLKNQPIDLVLASTGQQALDICQQQTIDVILLDIQLPDINGVEVARHLRALVNYQHIPILAFTAHALEQEKAEYIAAGMNDVILKPLQPNKLQQILQWCAINSDIT